MSTERKTNWDNLITGDDLAKRIRERKSPYVVKKARKLALSEYEEEGWELVRQLKDGKHVTLRKEKPFDEQFEDRVWILFAQMGFKTLNKDRNFEMTYDKDHPEFTQQIDVFAADDETVVIVECKASELEDQEVQFKKKIEAFHGQIEGLTKEAHKMFPDHKVKYIWATHNSAISRADKKKLDDWGILHFDDAVVEYYESLTRHLGSAARYQFLGNLLEGAKINNLAMDVPAIRGKMGGVTYFMFAIEPEKLLKIGYVLHRDKASSHALPTYQRIIKKKRLNEVRKFVNNGGYFPNSIILSIDSFGKGPMFNRSPMQVEEVNATAGVLKLPNSYRTAYIIDGQHRLYGYSDTRYGSKDVIPVVAFYDMDKETQMRLFFEINENQKAVSKRLRVSLEGDMLWDSEDYNERRTALRSRLASLLGEDYNSPLHNRVITDDENKQTHKRCITIEALQTALKRTAFFTTFKNKQDIASNGTFDNGNLEETMDKIYYFICDCLLYFKNNAKEEWELGDEGVLTMNRGIDGLIRTIDDIVLQLIKENKIDPLKDSIDTLVQEVEYYLEPLAAYFNAISPAQRKDIKTNMGSGAAKRFFRTFEKVIADERPDFRPEGLVEYLENESQEFNDSSRKCLAVMKAKIKDMVSEELQSEYGDTWEKQGLPKPLYNSLSRKALDIKLSDESESADEVTPWDLVGFSDIRDIALYGSQWSNMFAEMLVRPEERGQGRKEDKTQWLLTLDREDNSLRNPRYSISKATYQYISEIYSWLMKDNDSSEEE